MSNEDPRKVVAVALALCLVCSVAVSAAAVLLRPLQERNEALALKREILEVAGLYRPGEKVDVLFAQVEARIVDLATGEYAADIDPATFDQRKAARDPVLGVPVPPGQDVASIKRRARFAPVYLVREGDRPDLIILPVHGYGLWSTMYGLLALEGDGRTIAGLSFYEHAETAGLGSEITNPRWLGQWEGKSAVDDRGVPRIRVVKGGAAAADARYQVDGLSGATLTGNGVTNLMHYWLSERGFGPFLERIRSGEG
jgi:Na+-transporting NADH:ubiquinone oxidoreductase subunit C